MTAVAFVRTDLSRDPGAPPGTRAALAAPARPVHLGTLGTRSVRTLVGGDPADLIAEYRGFAEALADAARGDGTRRADICRGLACARALQGVLDVLIGEALSRRDFEAVAALGKQAERITRRIDSLLTQHRAELSPRRPVVVVKAESANVLAVEGAAS